MCRKSSLHSLRKRPRTGAFCNISPESSRIALMNWISQMDASTASRFRLSDSSDTRRPHGARRSQSRETPMSARACVRGDAGPTGSWFSPCHSRQMASSGAEHVPSEMDAHSERAKWAHLPARARRGAGFHPCPGLACRVRSMSQVKWTHTVSAQSGPISRHAHAQRKKESTRPICLAALRQIPDRHAVAGPAWLQT